MGIKFSPILPKPLNVAGMNQELIRTMQHLGEEIRETFEDTTRTWQHQPKWHPPTTVPKVGMNVITVETTTEDKRYLWVSEGTESHAIFPKNAKALAFPGNFIPKTFPGIISSGVGYKGPVDQFRNWVAHPGVEARKFDKEISDRMRIIFKNSLTNTMKLVAKASGHNLR